MKQTITIVFLVLITYTSVAQKIRFSDTSNIWTVNLYKLDFPPVSQTIFRYVNTVMVDTIPFLKYQNNVLIWEDTANQKVYCKLLPVSPNIDTSIQVLYDYRLSIGDTIRTTFYLNDTNTHFVNKIDSILISGTYHKIWDMQPVQPFTSNSHYPYIVIEGVGSSKGPLYPINPSGFEHAYRLVCFSNMGSLITIPDNQTIPNPYGGDYINPQSCLLSANKMQLTDQDISISPHPANATSNITLPYIFTDGSIVIFNTMGQVVTEQTIYNQSKIPVGSLKLNTGLYYYRITDVKGGKIWQGKLAYQ